MSSSLIILLLPFSSIALSLQGAAHQSCQSLARNNTNIIAARKTLAQQCLAAIHEADPFAPDYIKEIESTYRHLNNFEGSLIADSIYRYALAATSTAPLVHLELLISLGSIWMEKHREVDASRIYLEAIDLVQTMQNEKGFYGCVLVTLAALNEKMGLPIEAEKLYRRASAMPPYLGNSFGPLRGEMWKDWEDFELALARFLVRSHRYDEAEQIHKDRVATATGVEKAARLRDHISFLKSINRSAETIPLYQQLLANRETESDLHDYAEELLRSGNLDQAGKVIDDEIAAAGLKALNTAMQHKVQWMRLKGDEEGAQQLSQTIAGVPDRFQGTFDSRALKATQLTSDILQLINDGKFQDAHRNLDEVWPLVELDPSILRPRVIDEIAVAFSKANQQEEGAEVLKQNLGALERYYGYQAPYLFDALLGLACSAHKGLGNLQLALNLLDRASALAITADGEESTKMEDVYRSRYSILLSARDEAAASIQAEKLLGLAARIHGANNINVLEERNRIHSANSKDRQLPWLECR